MGKISNALLTIEDNVGQVVYTQIYLLGGTVDIINLLLSSITFINQTD